MTYKPDSNVDRRPRLVFRRKPAASFFNGGQSVSRMIGSRASCFGSASINGIGGSMLGGAKRRDCWAASSAIRCQRPRRLPPAWISLASQRAAATGTMEETPSSVAFSIAHSSRANLMTAIISTILGALVGWARVSLLSNSTSSPVEQFTAARKSLSWFGDLHQFAHPQPDDAARMMGPRATDLCPRPSDGLYEDSAKRHDQIPVCAGDLRNSSMITSREDETSCWQRFPRRSPRPGCHLGPWPFLTLSPAVRHNLALVTSQSSRPR